MSAIPIGEMTEDHMTDQDARLAQYAAGTLVEANSVQDMQLAERIAELEAELRRLQKVVDQAISFGDMTLDDNFVSRPGYEGDRDFTNKSNVPELYEELEKRESDGR